MSELFDRAYHCHVCKAAFTSKQVKTSAVRTKKREKDFHATFYGENPTYYGMICCSNCGFTQFESDFKKERTIQEIQLIKNTVSTRWRLQDFSGVRTIDDAIRVHTIAIVSYKVLGAAQSVMAKLYLRLAWFNREKGDLVENKKYTEMALAAFVQSYEQESLDHESGKELETMYLIGELNRQLGFYKEAIKWFDGVVRHEYAYKNRLIKGYAQEQWAYAAELFKLEKKSESE